MNTLTKSKFEEVERLASGIVLARELDGTLDAARELHARGIPPIMGAADAPVHPLAPPTVSGTNITVDLMLNQPTRITRMIMDLSLQRFIADRIFGNGGGVTGGAVVYDEATINELYAARDVQRIEPGAEFPIIETERRGPKVAPVEKWGGKVWIPDEARDRNQTVVFTNKVRQLTNTIIRKINQRAIDTLEAALAAYPSQVGVGTDWSAVVVGGSSQSNASEFPAADFALAAQKAEENELGINYDLWLLNPQEYTQLIIIYGAAGLRDLLAAMNVSVYVSNRVTAGTAYVVASGQVGEMRIEKPLGTETWREPGRERTWVQSGVRPVMFVNNPYAVRKFTGLAG
jgi:hypothetical protein